MARDRWERAYELFNRARHLRGEEIPGFLRRQCGSDEALRSDVASLLKNNKEGFMESPTHVLEGRPASLLERSGDPDLVDRPESIGPYKVLAVLGEGGMGVVYLAEQTEPVRRRVAVKLIKLGMDTKEVVARFEAERQALALMDHPSIARVYDAGATGNGRPYFVMEYVRGLALGAYCDRHKSTIEERLRLFLQVCQAMSHAHRRGIIHRDLKPSNILVNTPDDAPAAKIIDFGVARATNQRLTEKTLYTVIGHAVGTPAFMSPEQTGITDDDVDHRTDVYSLGVTLYELLVGELPMGEEMYTKAAFDEILRGIREDDPPTPSTRWSRLNIERRTEIAAGRRISHLALGNALRGDLDWIVMKAMEKQRERRYPTARHLADDIERYLKGEPVLAGPPGLAYRLQKSIRKNRGPVLAAGSIVLAIFLAFLASTAMYVVANRARAEREVALRQQKTATYIAEMNLIQRSIESGDVNSVAEMLAEQIPEPGEPDLRGYEWYYFWKRYGKRPESTLLRHDARVTCVAFSQNGNLLASGSWDHTVKLWETRTGTELSTLRWRSKIDELAVSYDARLVAVGAQDEIACWDLETSELRELGSRGARVTALAFAPDRNVLAAGRIDGIVRLRDLDSGAEESLESRTFSGMAVGGVRFSIDGRRVSVVFHTASVFAAPGVTVFDLDARTQESLYLGAAGRNFCAALSPDGRFLAAGGCDKNKLVLRDLETGQLKELPAHRDCVRALAFSPDGETLASGGDDTRILLWDLTGKNLPYEQSTLCGHRDYIFCLSYSADGELLASGSMDGHVRIWEVRKERKPEPFNVPVYSRSHGGIAIDIPPAFSPDGKLLAALSSAKTVSLVDLDSRQVQDSFELSSGTDGGSLAFSPNSSSLAVSGGDGTIWLWDLASRRLSPLKAAKETGRWFNHALAFSPDGGLLAGGFRSGRVELWDVTTRRELGTLEQMPNRKLRFSPDGQVLAGVSFSGEGKLKVVDVRTGGEVFAVGTGSIRRPDLPHPRAFVSVCLGFSPDGKLLASGQGYGIVKVWDLGKRREVLHLEGRTGEVCTLAFSPDGKDLATGGWDRCVRLWDLSLGQPRVAFREHPGSVLKVAFSPGGTMVSVCSRGNVIVWDAADPEDVEKSLASERTANQAPALNPRPPNSIDLGNIVAGGDGSPASPKLFTGVHPATGEFSNNLDLDEVQPAGVNPQPVESDVIDSVFLMLDDSSVVNTAGTRFQFPAGDSWPHTWDLIADTVEADGPPGRLWLGQEGTFSHGIGIHASAGITFDLGAIRARHGDGRVAFFSAFAGEGDMLGGSVNNHIILAGGDGRVLHAESTGPHRDGGRFLEVEIPRNARFLTLATGCAGNGVAQDHGVFCNAFITPCSVSDPGLCPSPPPDEILSFSGSSWSYLDEGAPPAAGWTARDFSTSGWKVGRAQLGYGQGDETTRIGSGGDADRKRVTAYFRRSFTVRKAAEITGLSLWLLRDDGAIVYLNGDEVHRSNLPSGPVDAETLATAPVEGDAEKRWVVTALDPRLLVDGTNVLAVEVHQAARTSPDVSFDLALAASRDR